MHPTSAMCRRAAALAMFAALFLVGATLAPPALQSQAPVHDAVNPAGERYTTDRVDITWTLGDVAASLHTTPELWYREGFQNPPLHIAALMSLLENWDVRLYPNPTQSDVTVAFNAAHEPCEFRLFGADGSEVARLAVPRDERGTRIDLREFPSGTYYLWLHDAAGATIGGFVVSKIR